MLAFLGIPDDPQGRKKPYADYGLYRTPCVRCGQRSRYQWTVGRGFRPVCSRCDLLMNELALRQMGHPQAVPLLSAYARLSEQRQQDIPAAALRRHRIALSPPT